LDPGIKVTARIDVPNPYNKGSFIWSTIAVSFPQIRSRADIISTSSDLQCSRAFALQDPFLVERQFGDVGDLLVTMRNLNRHRIGLVCAPADSHTTLQQLVRLNFPAHEEARVGA
jgi:hypothetical protein